MGVEAAAADAAELALAADAALEGTGVLKAPAAAIARSVASNCVR
ncbi:hypothetical protein BGC_13600 [Burkholderia sp. 3C]